MKVIGVIPARLRSTRLEEKILADIAGKPMIQHVWEQAQKARCLDGLLIACDDSQVYDVCQSFGADVVMTSPDHQSGTDRIQEVVSNIECDIVVNIQGDEPLVDPDLIDDLADVLRDNQVYSVSTAIKIIDTQEDLNNPNVVKVVVDVNGGALYFSRSLIPYCRVESENPFYKHLGIYAYRKEFLSIYAQLPQSALERSEKLEQLRVLEAGYKIKTVVTESESIGVDTLEDLERVKKKLES